MNPRMVDKLIRLGELCLRFGRVDRATYHEDGKTPESDTDHTVMLGVVGCSFAHEFLPQLDLGLVAQYALVHDFVEVYAGDTNTLRITAEGRESKRQAESRAARCLSDEFYAALPWLPTRLEEYEWNIAPEARYVRAFDKLLPKITHLLNNGATFRDLQVTPDELAQVYAEQVESLAEYASDFPPLMELRAELVQRVLELTSGHQR